MIFVMKMVGTGLASFLMIFAWSYRVPGWTAESDTSLQMPAERTVHAAKIDRLIRQLGSRDFTEREAAFKTLDALGEAALPALRKAQNHSDLEIRRRIGELVKLLTQRRAPMRAKAWAAYKEMRGRIDSDTNTSEGRIGVIDFRSPRTTVRDDDLRLLQWLDEVRCLNLSRTRITDAGLVHVKNCFQLERLSLADTEKMTDAGLEHVGNIRTLDSLSLGATWVSDAGLVHLKNLNNLTYLDLIATKITDAGLDHIKELKKLEWLNLSRTQVTDAGLTKLKQMKHLVFLDVSETQVTDAGLAHLREIRMLKTLWLGGTKVTDRGVAELKKTLPKLAIVQTTRHKG